METTECVSCFVKQALKSIKALTDDPQVMENVMRDVLTWITSMDYSRSPPYQVQHIQRIIRKYFSQQDPYQEAKRKISKIVEEMVPWLRKEIHDHL